MEKLEEEIRRMEEDMQSVLSETPSAKSRAQEIMDEVEAEEEEKSVVSQSQRRQPESSAGQPNDDDEEEEEDSDDDNHNVFYKA